MLDQARGALPYSLIHGEALVACAAWALGEAGVRLVDACVAWRDIADYGEPLVLHDSLCPMTPPEFIATCVRRALDEDVVVIGVRPVTDTVKVIAGDRLGETVDRDALVAVVSPLVLPARVAASLTAAPGSDLTALVERLARTEAVVPLEAPASARRVSSEDDLRLLEALTAS